MKIVVFVLYVFGLHTNYTYFYDPATPVPFTVCALAWLLSVPVLAMQVLSIKWKQNWPMVIFVLLAIAVTFFTAQQEYYLKSFKGVLQLIYSMVVAAGLYYLVLSMPRATLARVSFVLLLFVAAFSVLERIAAVGAISDKFRTLLDTGGVAGSVYDSDLRDMAMGGIRSKVFSLEPSHAAITFFWLSMVFIWSSRGRAPTIAVWLCACAASIWSIRSPILLVAVLCGVPAFGLVRRSRKASALPLELKALHLVVTLTLTGILLYVTWDLFSERAEEVAQVEGSFMMRVSGPGLFLTEFIPKFPFVGVGVVGDLDMLSDDLLGMYRAMGLSWMGAEYVGKTISNCLGLHFVYFGGLGGLAMLWLLLKASWIEERLLWLMVMVQVAAVWMSMGGYNSARVWCVSFALLAAARSKLLADAEEKSKANTIQGYSAYLWGQISPGRSEGAGLLGVRGSRAPGLFSP